MSVSILSVQANTNFPVHIFTALIRRMGKVIVSVCLSVHRWEGVPTLARSRPPKSGQDGGRGYPKVGTPLAKVGTSLARSGQEEGYPKVGTPSQGRYPQSGQDGGGGTPR